jgi:hypothetical protein
LSFSWHQGKASLAEAKRELHPATLYNYAHLIEVRITMKSAC